MVNIMTDKIKIHWTLGFIFNPTKTHVLLIKKFKKPKHHIGKRNGIGGNIEEGETFIECMHREILEEANVSAYGLEQFAQMKSNLWICECFRGFTGEISKAGQYEHETEEGNVRAIAIENVPKITIVCNVAWLVHMALDFDPERGIPTIPYHVK